MIKMAAGWEEGPYNKIWKFESGTYFANSILCRAIPENFKDLSLKIKEQHTFKEV